MRWVMPGAAEPREQHGCAAQQDRSAFDRTSRASVMQGRWPLLGRLYVIDVQATHLTRRQRADGDSTTT